MHHKALLNALLLSGLFAGQALAADIPPPPAAPAQPAPTQAPVRANTATTVKPLAVVNGKTIPTVYAEVVRQDAEARGQSHEKINDDAIRDTLINIEVQAQTALQKGLDTPERVRAILEIQHKEILVKLLQEDFLKNHKIAEESVKTEYDKAKARAGDMQYQARHILVANEKTAKDLIAQLTGKKKAKFEDLAKKYSQDSGSAKQGGDIGWINPSDLVPEFSSAMVKLKKNEITPAPVKTKFGWHVIKLEDSRKPEFPAYEEVKDRIVNQMLQIAYRKYVADLRTSAKIELPEAASK